MCEPAGAAGPSIASEVIPRLADVAAQIAAAHEEPAPATIAAALTTRVKALDLLFRGSTVPASYDAPSYAIVMTGHFASYRGGSRHSQIEWPRRGRCLIVVPWRCSSPAAGSAGYHGGNESPHGRPGER